MRGRLARVALLAVTGLVALAGCVTPAPDRGAYVQNARGALESAVSETATAALAVQARLDGRSTHAFADVVVTAGEQAIGPIEASFGGVDPPTAREDALRASTLEHLGAAGDALAAARLAVRRDDPAALEAATADLDEVTEELTAALGALEALAAAEDL